MSWKAPKRTPLQKLLYSGTGWLCLLIGVIGGFIPVLQGWIFVLAGVMILSREHEWVHDLVQKFKLRYPKVGRMMDRGADEAQKVMDKMLRRVRAKTA